MFVIDILLYLKSVVYTLYLIKNHYEILKFCKNLAEYSIISKKLIGTKYFATKYMACYGMERMPR